MDVLMASKQSFILKTLHGSIDNMATARKHFDIMKSVNGSWLIEYTPLNKRSLQQNAYLHAVLFPEYMKAWQNVGYDEINTPDIAKQIAKRRHLTKQIVNHDTGDVQEYVQDTSDLSKAECSIFVEAVIKESADNLGWVIPFPNTQNYFDF